jgi:hypothetical protein
VLQIGVSASRSKKCGDGGMRNLQPEFVEADGTSIDTGRWRPMATEKLGLFACVVLLPLKCSVSPAAAFDPRCLDKKSQAADHGRRLSAVRDAVPRRPV